MKTIEQALIDEISYPLPLGLLRNKLVCRGLDSEDEFNQEVGLSQKFRGCIADCLYSLIDAPNFTEADKTISLTDKQLILRKVNSIYTSIGEKQVGLEPAPCVYIGDYDC